MQTLYTLYIIFLSTKLRSQIQIDYLFKEGKKNKKAIHDNTKVKNVEIIP
jgi:hypothetical protein